MGQAQTKAARLGWREGAQATEEHTVNNWVGQSATETELVWRTAWLGAKGVRWGAGPGSGQVGDLHKVQQAQSCSKRKRGRTAWVERPGSRAGVDINWCADSLAWRKGVSGKTGTGQGQGHRRGRPRPKTRAREAGQGQGQGRGRAPEPGQGAGQGPGPHTRARSQGPGQGQDQGQGQGRKPTKKGNGPWSGQYNIIQ